MNNNTEIIRLWETTPGTTNTEPYIMRYKVDKPVTDAGIVLFPGSGYAVSPSRAPQEGERVARYLQSKGIQCFVVEYRVAPDYFPLPILDGRRAVRYVRHFAEKWNININKIAVLGYSAGGHLAASLCTYHGVLEYEGIDAIDTEEYLPNLQILCYPVINLCDDNTYAHTFSGRSLLHNRYDEMKRVLSPDLTASGQVPPAFIWHTFSDPEVNVINTLEYVKRLKLMEVPCEMHLFPEGGHGLGLPEDDNSAHKHLSVWIELMMGYLKFMGFLE